MQQDRLSPTIMCLTQQLPVLDLFSHLFHPRCSVVHLHHGQSNTKSASINRLKAHLLPNPVLVPEQQLAQRGDWCAGTVVIRYHYLSHSRHAIHSAHWLLTHVHGGVFLEANQPAASAARRSHDAVERSAPGQLSQYLDFGADCTRWGLPAYVHCVCQPAVMWLWSLQWQ